MSFIDVGGMMSLVGAINNVAQAIERHADAVVTVAKINANATTMAAGNTARYDKDGNAVRNKDRL